VNRDYFVKGAARARPEAPMERLAQFVSDSFDAQQQTAQQHSPAPHHLSVTSSLTSSSSSSSAAAGEVCGQQIVTAFEKINVPMSTLS